MTSEEPAIHCFHLKRSFVDGSQEREVLKDINLNVARGEIVCIMGPSGSGKTTLLHIVSCLDKPTAGEVYIDGALANGLNDDEMSKIRKRKIGMIFQDFYLLPTLSATENLEVPMIFDGMKEEERKNKATELLKLVDLSDCEHYIPQELSSGDKQKIAIARALANDPPIILADEPTGNLEANTAKDIVELLKSLTERGKAVLMVTHDTNIASYADRVLLLRNGVLFEHNVNSKEGC
jgi:putative ABC transport system ATP-binding protein